MQVKELAECLHNDHRPQVSTPASPKLGVEVCATGRWRQRPKVILRQGELEANLACRDSALTGRADIHREMVKRVKRSWRLAESLKDAQDHTKAGQSSEGI